LKRPHITAAAMDSYFGGPKAEAAPTAYDRAYPAHTYRIQDATHDELKRIADGEGVGLNELVRWWLGEFIQKYNAGGVELPIERYKVTRTRLGG